MSKKDNLLVHKYPEVAAQFHQTKNGDLKVEELTYGSGKKIWWKCEKNNKHIWDAKVSHRTSTNKTGCPFCSGKKVSEENSLVFLRPDIAEEWDYERNELTPSEVTFASSKKVWWICKSNKEHKWDASINLRTSGENQTGCPHCYRGNQTSFYEQAIYYYIKKIYSDTVNKHRHPLLSRKMEFDIFIPSLNTAIEYDGYYHSDKKYIKIDETKNIICSKNSIRLIRIRTENVTDIENYGSIVFKHKKNDIKMLECIIKDIFILLGIDNLPFEININMNKQVIYKLIDTDKKEQSIVKTHPLLCLEWNYKKNTGIDINSITHGSNKAVWWICSKNHEWEATPNDRSREKGRNCPFCVGKQVCIDNSLATLSPEISKQWNYERNGDLTPYNVTSGSSKYAWWKCEKEHEWEAAIYTRTGKRKNGCPYCSGKKVCLDNCLATLRPDLALQWHSTNNGEQTPYDVTLKSGKKVWWKCDRNHEWQGVIGSRSNDGSCPYCNGKFPSPEYNLGVMFPEVSKLWHPTKNGNLTPFDITPHSSKRVWWKKDNNEWEGTVLNTVKRKKLL